MAQDALLFCGCEEIQGISSVHTPNTISLRLEGSVHGATPDSQSTTWRVVEMGVGLFTHLNLQFNPVISMPNGRVTATLAMHASLLFLYPSICSAKALTQVTF